MKIKNIFFDYGRTIVEHPEDGVGLKIVKNTGLTNDEDIELVRNAVFSVGKYLNFVDEGSMSRDEYKRLLLEEIPKHLHSYTLKAADYHISELPIINGMEELLQKLKDDGYKLYITSNMSEYHAEQIRKTDIIKYFDDVIFSAEIKVRKPYRKFFEAAISKFGVNPEETVFIDDLEENVEGAKECGIDGFVFKGDAKAAEEYIYSKNK